MGSDAYNAKFALVMREFYDGKLKLASGKVVKDVEQAKAIAHSEAQKASRHKKK